LGANGVGKTTLLHVLAGLKKSDKGIILIENRNISQYPKKILARKIGLLFQDSQDTFPATVLETVLAGRYPHLPFWAMESADDIALSMQALEQVSLAAMTDRQVNTLSGGERRRLALATLYVQQPDIWLLDEPTNHLDLHHQITLLAMIGEKINTINGAAIMALHDVNLVTRFCSHALLMIDADTLIGGTVNEVVTTENLQRLYHHTIRLYETDGVKLFYPV
jgi:iron complex transport system ATP-binding protein